MNYANSTTIPGRCHRTDCRFCRWLCKKLDAIDPNHCRKAYLKDRIATLRYPGFDL